MSTVLAVSLGPLALALSAGVIVAFNPCGFAMLPAYMSYFVGSSAKEGDQPLAQRLVRAATVAGVVTLGFITVYGILGLVFTSLLSSIKEKVPFISIGVGVILAILGVTMVFGFEPKLSFLKVGAVGQGKGLKSLYVFGLSYAVVSLSCGFAGFTGVVVSTLKDGSILGAAATYVTFALGMGVVLMVLTLAAALAQQTVAKTMRRALPHINKASGFFLIVAGLYVAYYGYYSYKTLNNQKVPAGPVAWVDRWSSSVSTWLQSISTSTMVILIGAVLVVIVSAVGYSRRHASISPSTKEQA